MPFGIEGNRKKDERVRICHYMKHYPLFGNYMAVSTIGS